MKRLAIRRPLLIAGALTVPIAIAAGVFYSHRPAADTSVKTEPVNYIARPKLPTKPAAAPARPKIYGKPTVASPAANSTYYNHAIRENLFSAPVPAPAKEQPTPAPARVTVKVPQAPPPDPLADYVYAGSVTMDGKTAALIQSRTTNAGEYVVSGRRWNGFTIDSVSPREIRLTRDGAHRTLERSDTINVVQLSASAPQPVTPAAPAAPVAQPGRQDPNAAAAVAARSYQRAQRNEQRRMERQQQRQQQGWRSMYQQFRNSGRQFFGR